MLIRMVILEAPDGVHEGRSKNPEKFEIVAVTRVNKRYIQAKLDAGWLRVGAYYEQDRRFNVGSDRKLDQSRD